MPFFFINLNEKLISPEFKENIKHQSSVYSNNTFTSIGFEGCFFFFSTFFVPPDFWGAKYVPEIETCKWKGNIARTCDLYLSQSEEFHPCKIPFCFSRVRFIFFHTAHPEDHFTSEDVSGLDHSYISHHNMYVLKTLHLNTLLLFLLVFDFYIFFSLFISLL